LLRWQRNVGTTSGASNGQGDADGNGAVNAADLAVWKGKFGVPAAAVAGAVPEPGSLAFAAAGLASLAVARRNWNRV
jgi:transposase